MVELSMKELKTEFHKIDKNHDGKIDENELTKSLQVRMGEKAPSPNEIHNLIESADLDGDHQINFKEFIASDAFEEMLIASMNITAPDDDDDDDGNGNRKLKSSKKAKSTRKKTNHKKEFTEDELKKWFQRFDRNGDGKISKRELTRYLMKTGMEQDPSKKQSHKIMKSTDQDGDHEIDLEEFMSSTAIRELLLKLKSNQKKRVSSSSSSKQPSRGASSASSSSPRKKEDEEGASGTKSSRHQQEEVGAERNNVKSSLSSTTTPPADTSTRSAGKKEEDYETILSERNELQKTTKEQEAMIQKLKDEIAILKNDGNRDNGMAGSSVGAAVGVAAVVDDGQEGDQNGALEYLTKENERLNLQVKEYEEQIANFTESALERELELQQVQTNSITWMKIMETNVNIISKVFGRDDASNGNSNSNEVEDNAVKDSKNPTTSTEDEEIVPPPK